MNAIAHILNGTLASVTLAKSQYGHEQPTITFAYKSPIKAADKKIHKDFTVQGAALLFRAMLTIELAASPYAGDAAIASNEFSVWVEICEGANVPALMHLVQKVCATYNQR